MEILAGERDNVHDFQQVADCGGGGGTVAREHDVEDDVGVQQHPDRCRALR